MSLTIVIVNLAMRWSLDVVVGNRIRDLSSAKLRAILCVVVLAACLVESTASVEKPLRDSQHLVRNADGQQRSLWSRHSRLSKYDSTTTSTTHLLLRTARASSRTRIEADPKHYQAQQETSRARAKSTKMAAAMNKQGKMVSHYVLETAEESVLIALCSKQLADSTIGRTRKLDYIRCDSTILTFDRSTIVCASLWWMGDRWLDKCSLLTRWAMLLTFPIRARLTLLAAHESRNGRHRGVPSSEKEGRKITGSWFSGATICRG